MTMSTEIQKNGPMNLAEFDYGDDADKGFENQTNKDISTPFMKLLQGLSPELEKIDGAKPGMWFNSVTQQLYTREEGFLFVPSTTQHKVGVWTPRDKGGGFHGHMEIDDPKFLAAKERATAFGKYKDEEGNQLVECFYIYGVLCTEDGYPESPIIVTCSSTKIKAYRGWNSRVSQFRLVNKEKGTSQRPPIFSHLTRVTATKEKNDKGEFYVPKFASADARGLSFSLLKRDDDRFVAAKMFCETINAGTAKVDYAQSGAAADAEAGGDKVNW